MNSPFDWVRYAPFRLMQQSRSGRHQYGRPAVLGTAESIGDKALVLRQIALFTAFSGSQSNRIRNPIWPADESGVFEVRAATRYR
jgi:hypothetical protein